MAGVSDNSIKNVLPELKNPANEGNDTCSDKCNINTLVESCDNKTQSVDSTTCSKDDMTNVEKAPSKSENKNVSNQSNKETNANACSEKSNINTLVKSWNNKNQSVDSSSHTKDDMTNEVEKIPEGRSSKSKNKNKSDQNINRNNTISSKIQNYEDKESLSISKEFKSDKSLEKDTSSSSIYNKTKEEPKTSKQKSENKQDTDYINKKKDVIGDVISNADRIKEIDERVDLLNRSLRRLSKSPTRRSISPRFDRYTRSPIGYRKYSRSPTRVNLSPQRYNRSLEYDRHLRRRSRSPKPYTLKYSEYNEPEYRYPRRYSISPVRYVRYSTSPQRYDRSPERYYMPPDFTVKNSELPRRRSRSPILFYDKERNRVINDRQRSISPKYVRNKQTSIKSVIQTGLVPPGMEADFDFSTTQQPSRSVDRSRDFAPRMGRRIIERYSLSPPHSKSKRPEEILDSSMNYKEIVHHADQSSPKIRTLSSRREYKCFLEEIDDIFVDKRKTFSDDKLNRNRKSPLEEPKFANNEKRSLKESADFEKEKLLSKQKFADKNRKSSSKEEKPVVKKRKTFLEEIEEKLQLKQSNANATRNTSSVPLQRENSSNKQLFFPGTSPVSQINLNAGVQPGASHQLYNSQHGFPQHNALHVSLAMQHVPQPVPSPFLVQPINRPLLNIQPINHPVQSTQPINHPILNAQPINHPVLNTQPINHPVLNTQPMNHPVLNTQPNHPVLNTQPMNHSVLNTQPINHPVLNTQPINHPVLNTQPINHPVLITQPINRPVLNAQPINHPVPNTPPMHHSVPHTPPVHHPVPNTPMHHPVLNTNSSFHPGTQALMNEKEIFEKLLADKNMTLSECVRRAPQLADKPMDIQQKINVISRCQESIKLLNKTRKTDGRFVVKALCVESKKTGLSPFRKRNVKFPFTSLCQYEHTPSIAFLLDKFLMKLGEKGVLDIPKKELPSIPPTKLTTKLSPHGPHPVKQQTDSVEKQITSIRKETASISTQTDDISCSECELRNAIIKSNIYTQTNDAPLTFDMSCQVKPEEFEKPIKGILKNQALSILLSEELASNQNTPKFGGSSSTNSYMSNSRDTSSFKRDYSASKRPRISEHGFKVPESGEYEDRNDRRPYDNNNVNVDLYNPYDDNSNPNKYQQESDLRDKINSLTNTRLFSRDRPTYTKPFPSKSIPFGNFDYKLNLDFSKSYTSSRRDPSSKSLYDNSAPSNENYRNTRY